MYEWHAGRGALRAANLVGDDNGNGKNVSKLLEASQESAKVDLADRKFAAAIELRAVVGCCTVDNDQREAGLKHHSSSLREQLHLVVGVMGSCICHIVECGFRVEVESEEWKLPSVS